ncbi:MAG: PQQ-like beta-propeller repeat protein [Pirellulaceae bacterium]|jgi:outer membrane protein assembly factor BamB|nr:PQQ-like beta-propeller repeat protein [Pirellulaceae bacterium]
MRFSDYYRVGVLVCVLGVNVLGVNAEAGDWFQWRGPKGDGVSTETNWSAHWPADGPKILWQVELGVSDNNDGDSTASVVEGRVYVLGAGHMYCLDAESGKEVWKIPFGKSHSTPAVENGRVYIYGTHGHFMCLDAVSGETVWSKEMHEDKFSRRPGAYGYAASPTLMDDVVLISARLDGGALIALDKKSGDVKWKASHRGHRGYAFWSSPVVATIEEKKCIVWLTGPSIVGLNPETGETLWKHEIPEENGKVGCAAASPVVIGNRVVAQYHPPHARGYTFCLEIKEGKASKVWESRNLANWSQSCTGYDGCVFGVDQSPRGNRDREVGALQCYDIASGKLNWPVYGFGQDGSGPVRRTRTLAPTGCFTIADGKMISWANELVVAEISATGHRVLCSAKLPHVGYRATPVLSNGRLYLRTRSGKLLCVDVGKRQQAAADNQSTVSKPVAKETIAKKTVVGSPQSKRNRSRPLGGKPVGERFEKSKPAVGEMLPDVSGYSPDGKELPLKSLRGHYTVLVFGCLT